MSINLRVTAAVSALALLVQGGLAEAQDSSQCTDNSCRTLQVGLIASFVPALSAPGLGARIAISADDSLSLEIEVEWMDAGRHLYLSDQIVWHYALQVAHTLSAGGQDRTRTFATYGVSGWAERNATRTGLRTLFIPPFFPTAGAGAQWPLGSRAALRADVQVILFFGEGVVVAPRAAVGVSVPICFGRRSSS